MSGRPTVVQFGAGNIGRGFMGHIYTEAGYEVVFVDVAPDLVRGLQERREYPLRLAGPDRFETLTIRPVTAIDGRDRDAAAEALAAADFACTAVGVPVLAHVVPALARGIERRFATTDAPALNVVLCENQLRCSELLRGLLARQLGSEDLLARVGLVESVVSRMVPVVPEADRQSEPLLAVAEDYPRLPVDARGFVGVPPALPAFEPVENFAGYAERKLFLHNMGHAAAAYLGYYKGFEFVHEAMADPEVDALVRGAISECSEALTRKHGFEREGMREHWEYLLRRFRNAALQDTIRRVARDPIRKLGPNDRLIGALQTCLDWDVAPDHLLTVTAAALRYDDPEDPAAVRLQSLLASGGLYSVLREVCGIPPDGDLGLRIRHAHEQLPARLGR